jgi:DNA-binding MarR family transcriptional regulator
MTAEGFVFMGATLAKPLTIVNGSICTIVGKTRQTCEDEPVTKAGAAGREAWQLITEQFFNGEMQDRFHLASAGIGLAPGVMKVLMHLELDEAYPMRDLATHLRCDASYVTSVVDDLEARGYAERRPHGTDRRIKTIVLTEAGLAARQQALAVLYEPPAAITALDAGEQRQLRDLMRKISAVAASPT